MTIRDRTCRFLLASLFFLSAWGVGDTAPLDEDGRVPPAGETAERVRQVRTRLDAELMALPEVVGTGVGLGSDNKPAILLLLRNRVEEGGLPDRIEGIPVISVITGSVWHLPFEEEGGCRRGIDFSVAGSQGVSCLLDRIQRSSGMPDGADGLIEGVDITVDIDCGIRTVRLEGQILISSWEPFVWEDGGGTLLVTERGDRPVGILLGGNVTGKYAFAVPVTENPESNGE